MTLNEIGCRAIREAIRTGRTHPDPYRDAAVSAWLAWSMRDDPDTDRKAYNRARRTLQRHGRVKV